jgi:tRNA pseudouridine55 synthase
MSAARPRAGARPAAAVLDWSGLLPVDKPTGVTSHDVVDRARRALGTRAIGHLGTLDPAASGLLMLAVGAATRCAIVWQGGRKTYSGTARFGVVTDSQDLDGRVLETSESRPEPGAVRAALGELTGDLLQTPYGVGIKQGGERTLPDARRSEPWSEPRRCAWTHGAWPSSAPTSWLEVDCRAARRTSARPGARLAAVRHSPSCAVCRGEPFGVERACGWEKLS